MIWIMLYHSQINFPVFVGPVALIKSIGYAGVDIFFLLSGMGLSFSLSKNENILAFFKKRLVTIVPTFWLIIIMFSIKNLIVTGDFSINSLLLSLLGLDFVLNGQSGFWFIPSIFICYLFFPIYYYASNKYGMFNIPIICSAIALIFSLLISSSSLQYLLIFTVRLPVFFFGSCIGQLLVSGKRIQFLNSVWLSLTVLLITLIVAIPVLCNTSRERLWATGLWWFPRY